jgi:membrane-bound lytic murein transglycosylase D
VGLLALLGALAGCGGPPPSGNITDRTPVPARSASDPAPDLPDSLLQYQSQLVDAWESVFYDGRAREGVEPDSALFFRYQTLLSHLNPEEISSDARTLRSRAESLRVDVAAARDSAWMRWQTDLTPPPEPQPQSDPHAGYTIKPEMNDRVNEWLTHFTGSSRERFALWLWRSGTYRGQMEQILAEEGVPPELVGIVFIESGFHLAARSRARAVGPWQFISGTARHFGLTINRHRDERRDFELATRAAGRYLKALYNLFGDWNLVLASYNCGENRVFRQIARQKTNNFWALDLPRETEDYVPEFHAVLHILAEPERFGFSTETSPPLTWEEVELPGPVRVSELAKNCGSMIEDVKALNPAWLRNITPADGKSVKARVPTGTAEKLALAQLSIVPKSEAKNVGGTHRVRKGETLSRIARRYGVSTASLARANGLSTKSRVRTGRVLQLPDGAEEPVMASRTPSRSRASSRTRDTASTASDGEYQYHVVRQGDSLWSISQKYGISLAQLNAINGLGRRSVLKPGQKVKVSR